MKGEADCLRYIGQMQPSQYRWVSGRSDSEEGADLAEGFSDDLRGESQRRLKAGMRPPRRGPRQSEVGVRRKRKSRGGHEVGAMASRMSNCGAHQRARKSVTNH